jgi:hypothetical protein
MASFYTVNTSSDSKYFSRVINLIGSVRQYCDKSIKVRVWDLGLTDIQKYILKSLNVEISEIPKFAKWWNVCYSWKLYVYHHSKDEIFLHLDAGNTVLTDIKNIFKNIENDDSFLIDQGQNLRTITPLDYVDLFYKNINLDELAFAAGNIGLNKKNPEISAAILEAYNAALDGYCLGFSESELHRDIYGLKIKRNCAQFRHDQTIINLILRKHFKNIKLFNCIEYAAISIGASTKIYNQRGYSYKYFKSLKIGLPGYAILIYCVITDVASRVKRKLSSIY